MEPNPQINAPPLTPISRARRPTFQHLAFLLNPLSPPSFQFSWGAGESVSWGGVLGCSYLPPEAKRARPRRLSVLCLEKWLGWFFAFFFCARSLIGNPSVISESFFCSLLFNRNRYFKFNADIARSLDVRNVRYSAAIGISHRAAQAAAHHYHHPPRPPHSQLTIGLTTRHKTTHDCNGTL